MAWDAGRDRQYGVYQFSVASLRPILTARGMFRALPQDRRRARQEFLIDYFPKDTSLAQIYDILFRKGSSWPVSYEHDTRIVDVAIYKEMDKGHGVFLDYAENPQDFSFGLLSERTRDRYIGEMRHNLGEEERRASPLNRLREINPQAVEWFAEHGINLSAGEKIEVGICAQHFQEGKDQGARKFFAFGLYAAGECAGSTRGQDLGAFLLDCQVLAG